MIALTINLGMFEAITRRDSMVKGEIEPNMQEMEWSQTYGGTGNDYTRALVQTIDLGFALAGGTRSYGAVDYDMGLVGDYKMWLLKTDENGDAQWNQSFGGTGNDGANALVQTSDGGFALAGGTHSFGASEGDMWLVKTEVGKSVGKGIPGFGMVILLTTLVGFGLSRRYRKSLKG